LLTMCTPSSYTTVVYDDGVHIVNNIWYKARPMVADWLAQAI